MSALTEDEQYQFEESLLLLHHLRRVGDNKLVYKPLDCELTLVERVTRTNNPRVHNPYDMQLVLGSMQLDAVVYNDPNAEWRGSHSFPTTDARRPGALDYYHILFESVSHHKEHWVTYTRKRWWGLRQEEYQTKEHETVLVGQYDTLEDGAWWDYLREYLPVLEEWKMQWTQELIAEPVSQMGAEFTHQKELDAKLAKRAKLSAEFEVELRDK